MIQKQIAKRELLMRNFQVKFLYFFRIELDF